MTLILRSEEKVEEGFWGSAEREWVSCCCFCNLVSVLLGISFVDGILVEEKEWEDGWMRKDERTDRINRCVR